MKNHVSTEIEFLKLKIEIKRKEETHRLDLCSESRQRKTTQTTKQVLGMLKYILRSPGSNWRSWNEILE